MFDEEVCSAKTEIGECWIII